MEAPFFIFGTKTPEMTGENAKIAMEKCRGKCYAFTIKREGGREDGAGAEVPQTQGQERQKPGGLPLAAEKGA